METTQRQTAFSESAFGGLGLAGVTGYVGSTLTRQVKVVTGFDSRTIEEVGDHSFDNFVCAAAPAQKWLANRDPISDKENIQRLISNLKKVKCRKFCLISTVDVFKNPFEVDESHEVDETGLHPYGLHRRLLEKFVEATFPSYLIIRLPGLVGPGLRKNIIFDLLNENNLDSVDCRSIFQFYPMINLWYDMRIALCTDLKLVHFATEPLRVAEVAYEGFNRQFDRKLLNTPPSYDMRSRHADLFGGINYYLYSQRESIQAIRAYAQTESRTIKSAPQVVQ